MSIFLKISTILILFSFSCKNNNIYSNKEISFEFMIMSPNNNQKYEIGDSVKIYFSIKGEYDSLKVTCDERVIECFKLNSQRMYKKSFKESSVGQKTLRILAYKGGIYVKKDIDLLFYSKKKVKDFSFKVIAVRLHDIKSYTQGLEIYENLILESTGIYGKSILKKNDLNSYALVEEVKLENRFFGEGITVMNNKIYQITWHERTGFIYDLNFKKIGNFYYSGEGWGLANDGKYIYMSNGSNKIAVLDSVKMSPIKYISVYQNDMPIDMLNELEYVNGKIFANIYHTKKIAVIDANSGIVEGYIDFSLIFDHEEYRKNTGKEVDVLNGIAYNKKKNTFLITGKFWPKMYEVKINMNN